MAVAAGGGGSNWGGVGSAGGGPGWGPAALVGRDRPAGGGDGGWLLAAGGDRAADESFWDLGGSWWTAALSASEEGALRGDES